MRKDPFAKKALEKKNKKKQTKKNKKKKNNNNKKKNRKKGVENFHAWFRWGCLGTQSTPPPSLDPPLEVVSYRDTSYRIVR